MGTILALTFIIILLLLIIPPLIVIGIKLMGGYIEWLKDKFDI